MWELRIVGYGERLEDARVVDRRESSRQIPGAGDVLRPLPQHRPAHRGVLCPKALGFPIDGIEPKLFQQDVRRGVVGERQHQERAVAERDRAGEPVGERPRGRLDLGTLARIEPRTPECRRDEELDRRGSWHNPAAALLPPVGATPT